MIDKYALFPTFPCIIAKIIVFLPKNCEMKFEIWKLIYCLLWSVALFVSTFYSLFNHVEKAFVFTDAKLLDVAQSHIMPLVMAMTLYIWDVVYNITLNNSSKQTIIPVLLSILVFLVMMVFSILVNNNIWGWGLFCLAWVALSFMKYATTESLKSSTYIISEE